MNSHKITLLGTGLIGQLYTMTLHGQRGRDRVHTACALTNEEARTFAEKWDKPNFTSDIEKAGVFAGYLEDLYYTPKTLKALQSVKNGVVGTVL
jgi:hypothetical protein